MKQQSIARASTGCVRYARRKGFTLIETLVVTLIMSVLGAGLWTLIRSSLDSQYEVLGQNTANTYARQCIDEIADNLRGATAVTAGAASDISFTNNSGQTIRYYRNEGRLLKTTNGSGSTAIATSVQSISFTYWMYNNGAWTITTSPSTPANVKAVDFSIVDRFNGCQRQVSGSVKLRQK